MRRVVFALSFALVAFSSAVSSAAGDCPDGWFCEPGAAPVPAAPGPVPAAPASAPAAPAPAAPASGQPGPPPPPRVAPAPSPPMAPPPGPVYGPVVYPPAGYYLLPPEPPPKKKKHKRRHKTHEWGFNLHADGAVLGNQPDHSRGMGGLGMGFRYRAIPSLAFDASVELMRGAEFDQHFHREAAFLLNTLVFFNPRDVVQFYGLVGMSFSSSTWVDVHHSNDNVSYDDGDLHRSYFGGQLGLGLEVRVSRHLAIGGDVIGFVRGRTDEHDGEGNDPDAVPRDVNVTEHSSGIGMVRGGLTIYW